MKGWDKICRADKEYNKIENSDYKKYLENKIFKQTNKWRNMRRFNKSTLGNKNGYEK